MAQRTGALGNFDQGNAHVAHHIHQHFAQVFLLVVLAHAMVGCQRVANGGHLQNAIDELGDFIPKAFGHRLQAQQPFPHGAVKHGRL